MALTVTPNLIDISLCEAVDTWSDGALNDLFNIEGTNCLGLKVSAIQSALITYTPGAALDFSSGEHMYFWTLVTGAITTKALGGIQIYFETDSSNYSYYNVGGNENYNGGWRCWVVSPAVTRSSGLGTLTLSNITKIGVRFYTTTTSLGNNANCFWDAVRYGTGLTLTSGATDLVGLEDIITAENADKYWGVLQRYEGVYFQQGKLIFGDSSGTDNIDFLEKSKTWVMADPEFGGVNLNAIEIVGNATGSSNFVLGEKSGDRGISGCTLVSPGTIAFDFTATNANISKLQIYGCNFINADAIDLPAYDSGTPTNREVLSTGFEGCGVFTVSTCVVKYCNIVNSDDNGFTLGSVSHNVSDVNIINPTNNGVEITVAGSFDFTTIIFSGTTSIGPYDIENAVVPSTSDSYSEANQDQDQEVGDDTTNAVGQSFDGDGNVLSGVVLWLKAVASPIGNAVVKIYAHSGTYGTDGVPTGSALATSNVVDVSGIGGVYELVHFEFEDEYTLVSGTKYFAVLEYNGTATDYLHWGRDGSAPTHGGNVARYTTVWAYDASVDLCFYVYTSGIITINALTNANPQFDSNPNYGATIINNNVWLELNGFDQAGIRCRIEAISGGSLAVGTQMMSEETVLDGSDYLAKEQFNYTSPQPIRYIARLKGYMPIDEESTVDSGGLKITVPWELDADVD